MTPIIEVKNLTHRYGSLTAVDTVSFAVEKGSFFACLGPNGAGKSTTISVLTTLAGLQAGTVAYSVTGDDPWLVGQDDAAIRSKIGVVFQDSLLDGTQSVRANLETRASLYQVDTIAPVVDTLQLADILKRPYGKLSGGQRRRVDIARALLASPEILFLDEPTTGLDPQSRNLVWETIDSLRQEGLTVFLTTHYMHEAEQTDQVMIIDHGKLIAFGSPAELRAQYAQNKVRLRGHLLADALRTSNLDFTETVDTFVIPVDTSEQARAIINDYAHLIDDFEVVRGTMDDVFLTLTGTTIRED